MSERRSYSDETKAAVMAALLAGQSVSSAAKEYKIPKGTVSSWKEIAQKGVGGIATQKKEELGDLLLGYVRLSLKSLQIQVQHFGNKSWLTNQDADALAVLHGVQTDKAIRLLEAIAQAGDAATQPD